MLSGSKQEAHALWQQEGWLIHSLCVEPGRFNVPKCHQKICDLMGLVVTPIRNTQTFDYSCTGLGLNPRLNLWVVGLTGVLPPFPYPGARHTEGLVQMDLLQDLLEEGPPQAWQSENWKVGCGK